MEMQSDWMKEYYDSHNSKEGHKLGNGDAVNPCRKKAISPKLQHSWECPYVIIKTLCTVSSWKAIVIYRNRLWLYTGAKVPAWNGVD